jgi:hypothetical protein
MQTLRKFDVDALDPREPDGDTLLNLKPILGLAGDAHAEALSPARVLQQRLLAEMAAEAEDDDGVRWSPRATMLFVCGVSLALWGAIALVVAAFH